MELVKIFEEVIKRLDESVYTHNIVIRWDNGELEGFSGTALSGAKRAKESAEAKASRKAAMIKKQFFILDHKSFSQLDSAQKKRLKRDWELSQKMDESLDIKIRTDLAESKSGKDKFEYKGLDCYIKWTRFEENKEKKVLEYTMYSAHCDDLDLHTKGYETHTEAKKELKKLIDESIKDRDLKEENNDYYADQNLREDVRLQVKKGYELLSEFMSKSEKYIKDTKDILAEDKSNKYGKKLKVFLSVFEKINKFVEDEHYKNKINYLMKGNLTEAIEDNEEEKKDSIDYDSEEFRKNEREVAKELVASLSVFLFAVESIFKQEFESAKNAEEFIFSAFRSLKTREVDVLRNMLRRFDKVGGERMANLFRRTLNRNLMK